MTDKRKSKDNKEPTEFELLVQEKRELAQSLGLIGNTTKKEGYKETSEYNRIKEIDQRLWELVK